MGRLSAGYAKALMFFCALFLLLSVSLTIAISAGRNAQQVVDQTKVQTGYENITSEELKAKLDKREVFILIDIRSSSLYDAGHIWGAVSIPLYELSTRLNGLERNKEIIVYCQIGVTSISACELLVSSGFSNVKNLFGGISEWKYGIVVRDSMIII